MISLTAENAIQKYGEKGKNGAIEVSGTNLLLKLPPPIISKEIASTKKVVILPPPPPIVTPDSKTEFYPKNVYNSSETKPIKVELRYIIVNGKGVEDNSKIGGYTNVENIKYLTPALAIKKYGKEKGKYGAVEITGNNIKYLSKIKPIEVEPRLKIKKDDENFSSQFVTFSNPVNLSGIIDSGVIVVDNKIVKLNGRKFKHYTAESVTIYPKDKPQAIVNAVKLYGPKAKNGVIVLTKGKIEFEK